MGLLAAERIKLLSTRSPWWCMVVAVAFPVGMATLVSRTSTGRLSLSSIEYFTVVGMVMIMVMAALSVTTEYRFGTIRTSFAAVPHRAALLLAKATMVVLLAGVTGELAGFACFAVARLARPEAGLALRTGADWRTVVGGGVVWALAALIAIAVGVLLRHTAGAVSALLVYTLLGENLVTFIPRVGPVIQHWLPFTAANQFRTAGQALAHSADGPPQPAAGVPYGPWMGLAYLAAITAVLLGVAVLTARRRDA